MELETIIGLEIHAQLDTKTKMFSRDDNDAWLAQPNTKINPVSMGFPGMLPVINREAVEKGIVAALALGCEIQKFSKFDRKNYFYPDLPSGYQISQYDQPLSKNGRVEVLFEGKKLNIGITRLHLENDAGKLTHSASGTLCDYNRAGTPLAEIVTEPDLRSPEEAQALAREIQKIMRYTGASKADMEKGMMRFDASISLRPKGESKLYPRTEIKNLNSFQSLLKALKYEEREQKALWEAGKAPSIDRTVGWLDDEERTQMLREKESAHDYRYFPEPDLPPLTFTEAQIEAFRKKVPELPLAKFERYTRTIGLSEEQALTITEDIDLARFFDQTVTKENAPLKIANLLTSSVVADPAWKESHLTPDSFAELIHCIETGKVSHTAAKTILKGLMESEKSAETLIKELGLEQNSDTSALKSWCEEALTENPSAIEDYKAGKDRAIQFLMGQVMKKSKGSANGGLVMQTLKELLSAR